MATQDIKSLNESELQTELVSLEETLTANYFQHKSGGLQNPRELSSIRKEIARIKTELRSRELQLMSADELQLRSKIRSRRR